jgi:hypothetical protein
MAFTLWLGITLAVILMVIYIIIPLLKSDQSKASFLLFNKKIDTIANAQSGETGYFLLETAQGGGVVIFNEQSSVFTARFAIKWTDSLKKSIIEELANNPPGITLTDWDVIFSRPTACTDLNKACICYAKKIKLSQVAGNLFMANFDQKVTCKTVAAQLYLNFKECDKDVKNYCFKGSTDGRQNWFIASTLVKQQPRFTPIYLEKYKDVVAIGLTDATLSPTDKKIIDLNFGIKKSMLDCANNQYCADPTEQINGLLSDVGEEKVKWHLDVVKKQKTVKAADGTSSTVDYVEMKFDKYNAGYVIDEIVDLDVTKLFIVPVKLQGQTVMPDFSKQEELDGFELRYVKATDDFVTIGIQQRDEEHLVTIGNSFTNFIGPPTLEQIESKPYPLYFFYLDTVK